MTIQQYYQYSFIAVVFLCLLIQNYINVRHYGVRTPATRFLRFFILGMIGCSTLEVVYGLREAGIFGSNLEFAYSVEILYNVVTMISAYLWYIASELCQKSVMVATRRMRTIVSIPLVIMLAVTVLTPFHHLNFYFENGHYVRGPLVLVFSVVLAVFISGTGFAALVKSFRGSFYMERIYFRIIFLYAAILLISEGAQLMIGPVMPFRTMGAALVIYIIQQKYIKGNIYQDSLTGANNRNAADRYLNNHMDDKEQNLQVAMIDADHFKEINDTFGHQAGDHALQMLAQSFMQNLPGSTFFARYGGDEFILMGTAEDTTELEKTVQKARVTLKQLCTREKVRFTLDFSCGIVQKTEEMKTIPDVLEAADAAMYMIKKAKKAER